MNVNLPALPTALGLMPDLKKRRPAASGEETSPAGSPAAPLDINAELHPKVSMALVDAVRKIQLAPAGSQEDILNRQAYRLGAICGGGHCNPERALQALVEAGLQMKTFDESAPWTEHQIVEKVSRSLQDGQGHPDFDFTAASPDASQHPQHPQHPQYPPFDDIGNGERLAKHCKGEIFHCDELSDAYKNGWIVWVDKKSWVKDIGGSLIQERAKAACRAIEEEKPHILGPDKVNVRTGEITAPGRNFTLEHAQKSASGLKLGYMIRLASSIPAVKAKLEKFDAKPMLFACANATVDLSTGTSYRPRRTDYLLTSSPVVYDKEATCPRWKKFIRECHEREPVRQFLQDYVGYCLTGSTIEQKMIFHVGHGGSGKSTFVEVLLQLFGEYGETAAATAFTYHQQNIKRNDLAKIRAARFVSASETRRGEQLDQATVKRLTGGDTIDAEEKGKNPFSYKPQYKANLLTNADPNLDDVDYAIMRRVMILNWQKSFGEKGSPPKDEHLSEKLVAELPGILNWAIEGCLNWQKHGLRIPPEISVESQRYFEEQDRLGPFLSDCTALNPDGRIPQKELFDLYCRYEKDNRARVAKHTFFSQMRMRPTIFPKRLSLNGKMTRFFCGLELSDNGLKFMSTPDNTLTGGFSR